MEDIVVSGLRQGQVKADIGGEHHQGAGNLARQMPGCQLPEPTRNPGSDQDGDKGDRAPDQHHLMHRI